MAWSCHGADNDTMCAALKKAGIIQSPAVEAAMRAVDRALFVPLHKNAYNDSPQHIGHGATISAPHMHASCLELLAGHLKPGTKVLDVGSGSGYLTAVMAVMVGGGGGSAISAPSSGPAANGVNHAGARAVGIEHVWELVESSKRAVRAVDHPAVQRMLQDGTLRLLQGDGRQGYEPDAPYDCIHVGAAAPQIPPALVAQLRAGGRMVIPVGPEGEPQKLMVVDKRQDGRVEAHDAMGVIYVPLTTLDHQLQRT